MYLGIDLGTSNSAIVGNRGGRLDLYKAVSGEDVLASVVMADRHGSRYVGKRAYEQLRTSPKGIAARFKRLLGTSTILPFGPEEDSITPEEASSEVLRQLLKQMRATLGDGEAIDGAVVTVPAAFNQMQSEATIRAARAAGLTQVGLLQEPIAAALACIEKPDARTGLFLVYDLGGGTFDVALVRAIDGQVSIEAHEGINMLGGSDFDRMIVESFVRPWLEREFALPQGWQTDPAYRRLLALATANAEAAKIELSSAPEAIIFVSEHDARATDGNGREMFVEIVLRRADLDGLVADKVDQSIDLCRKVIADHGYGAGDISKVVLIGGPSRMPIIRERVPADLGIATDLDIDPMTAVARGAAIYAESRNWASGEAEAKPARVAQAAGADVSYDYEARTARDRGRIRVTAAGGGDGLRVSAASDDGRDYGERPVSESPVFVVALGEGETRVRMTVTDAVGARVEEACADLVITRVQAAAAGAPCTSTIAVKVEDGDGTRAVNVLEPLIRKGETLPRKGARTFRSARRLDPGSEEHIDVELFEQAEGVLEPEANLLIGSFRLSGADLPAYAAPLRPGEQVVLHWSVDDSQLIRCSIELPEQGLHLRDHSFYMDDLARVDFATHGRSYATVALDRAAVALEAFDGLDAAVHLQFGSHIRQLDQRIRDQFRRLDSAIEADTFRSIAEEARLLRQDISRLRHRPELRIQIVRSDLYRVEARSRALLATLSQADRERIDQLRTAAEQALEEGRIAIADRTIKAIDQLLMGAQRQRPEFFVEAFAYLQLQRNISTDPARFDMLVTRGRAALASGDLGTVQDVCQGLVGILNFPREQEADVAALAGLRR
ncbi:Hsp70 family protein [Sphingobium sp. CAP-1]|uniref:Hsp70 family protein n=1 Tax=Sphingobium sp. CAP-1 TaxID=2676077 RepID=UPI0012BB2643|nr:Hsp70 family protein [Sphingobium sp. CAP-1]QGP81265.1 Hsp70 family protein [Sphingobium sp. CAP-1]